MDHLKLACQQIENFKQCASPAKLADERLALAQAEAQIAIAEALISIQEDVAWFRQVVPWCP